MEFIILLSLIIAIQASNWIRSGEVMNKTSSRDVADWGKYCQDILDREIEDTREFFKRYLYDQLDLNYVQIEDNKERISSVKAQNHSSEASEINGLHAMDLALWRKKKEIEDELLDLLSLSQRKSPNSKRLIAIYWALMNKSVPVDIARIITLDQREQMYLRHVQFMIDYCQNDLYSHHPKALIHPGHSIRSLGHIDLSRFEGRVLDLSHHSIESYQNVQFPECCYVLNLAFTELNTHKLRQIKFPNISRLVLSGNPNVRSFENISFPSSLHVIELGQMSLSAQGIRSLNLPQNSRQISLERNAFNGRDTIDALNDLFARKPDLLFLDLSHCNLTALEYQRLMIGQLKELKTLLLNCNSNEGIRSLRLPKSLRRLEWYGVIWNRQRLIDLESIITSQQSFFLSISGCDVDKDEFSTIMGDHVHAESSDEESD